MIFCGIRVVKLRRYRLGEQGYKMNKEHAGFLSSSDQWFKVCETVTQEIFFLWVYVLHKASGHVSSDEVCGV